MMNNVIFFSFLFYYLTNSEHSIDLKTVTIPPNLLLGSASSSYQIEGAWNEDGKGENIWDRMTHTQAHKIRDGSNGDTACDSYHKLDEDINIIRNLNLQFYRFSLSWTRILPNGFPNKVNEAGVNYYNNLINKLLEIGVMPVVTIFHWDLPQTFQEYGGWANPNIVHWFESYAEVVFKTFGDRVQLWITMNEPKHICSKGYSLGTHAPGITSNGIANYICAHNLLKAHAKVYHLYNTYYRSTQHGKIGINIECTWFEPVSNETADKVAAERKRQFDYGIYAHPIFSSTGDYPNLVKKHVTQRSTLEGFKSSRLPHFTAKEVQYVKGTSDFFGLNHYAAFKVRDIKAAPIGEPSEEYDVNTDIVLEYENEKRWSFYFKSQPWAFRNTLNEIKENYGNPDIYVFETGLPDEEELNDHSRIKYLRENLDAVVAAIQEDQVRVKAFTVWSLLDSFEWTSGYTDDLTSQRFPDDFIFGTASSALQIEGASNKDGKTVSMWDHFVHNHPEKIKDGTNMDVTCNSYYKTKEDVALLKNLGVDFYRFSISWARILPNGFSNYINQVGIDYYNNLINELLANNIKPMITMYHWELPLSLSHLGGFTNRDIAIWFEDYANILFTHFGDRVKMWITFNEPRIMCDLGYGLGDFAPGINQSGVADYLCGHNLLRAHSRVYHLYYKNFKQLQNGHIGIAVDMQWYEPGTNSTRDVQAAERQLQFHVGRFLHPILSESGDYPNILKDVINDRSEKEGFIHSRLPKFTKNEVQKIIGTADFIGINHYTTFLTRNREYQPIGDPSQENDCSTLKFQEASWPGSAVPLFKTVPWGIRKALKWFEANYRKTDIYITENGFADSKELNDDGRINYHKSYLSNILDAIHEDKVPVKGYAVWSFMDLFEWNSGYTIAFGLYHVNFSDPIRPRTPKKSAYFYKQLIKTRQLLQKN
ncbi:hypothetical protein FQA39_LY09402 [Lamprigera yunnana]|nr:hypothetical protein FQA39_LY09402 [Lamprigera yunnana]